MQLTEQSFLVRPDIGLLNQYLQKAKKVAITEVNPVFSAVDVESERRRLQALRIQVEGPSRALAYFGKLVEGANLQFKA